ncbi:MAG: hypothetical protein ACHQCE_14860 [Streptosporangiales bacterium]
MRIRTRTQQEYFRLYDVSARAIKSVHPGLRVGGPASAAAGWTRELLAHLDASGARLDFLSSHVYGNVPLDLRTGQVPPQNLWWTEWGVTPTAWHYRIDAEHSNIVTAWEKLRDGPDRAAWPRDGQWRTLREMNALDELGPPARFTAGNGLLGLAFELPMPGVSYLELAPLNPLNA